MILMPKLTIYKVEQRFAIGRNTIISIDDQSKRMTIGAYMTVLHRCYSWQWQ